MRAIDVIKSFNLDAYDAARLYPRSFINEDTMTECIPGTTTFPPFARPPFFAFPNRLQEGNSYIPLFTFADTDSAMLLGLFGKVCVALFLFLGGYGTWMSYQAKYASSSSPIDKTVTSPQDISKFIFNKIKKLYIPFLKVFAITIPIAILLGDTQVKLNTTALFWNITGLNITYNGEWWFFTDYLILLAAFPLISRFIGRKNAVFSVDLLAICLWNAAVTWLVPSLCQAEWMNDFTNSIIWKKLYQTMLWSSCFVIGCLFARWNVLSQAKEHFSGHYLACFASLVGLVALVWLRYRLNVGYRYDFLFAPLICIMFAVIATTRFGSLIARPLKFVGAYSTDIWLTHSFFCYHWCQSVIYLPKWSPLVFLLLLGVSLGFSLVIETLWKQAGKAFALLDSKMSYRTIN